MNERNELTGVDAARGHGQAAYLEHLRAMPLEALSRHMANMEAFYRTANGESRKITGVCLVDVQTVAAERGLIVRPEMHHDLGGEG